MSSSTRQTGAAEMAAGGHLGPGRLVTAPVILSELRLGGPETWQPGSFSEWEAREQTRTFLGAWSEQMTHERLLRSCCAKWIFALIAAQVAGAFGIVALQGFGWMNLDHTVLKVMVPSVLMEVFGLRFLVTKYLFSQPIRHGLDALVIRSRHAHQTS